MKIFEPLTVRGMVLKNRIVMPPMLVGIGFRSERARSYYGERAKGGVAAVTVAGTSVDLFATDEAWGKPGGLAAFVEGSRLLTETVHQAGAKIGVQLWYGNRFPAGAGEADGRGEPVAPSPRGDMRALTISEIEEIFSRFAQGFLKAKEIGFDFAEIHGAHGYLLSQFFSPIDNHRTDEYGGDLSGRMKFGTECVKAVRRAVGDGYPIFFRLGAWEDRPGGITIDESVQFAQKLEKCGVDVLDISLGATVQPSASAISGPRSPEGSLVPYAAAIKKKVGIPVIAVGRIKTSAYAESVLTEGKADLVAIGRQLIADPFWLQKVKEGKEDEIVPCISCNTCLDTGPRGLGLKCSVNASVARESEYRIKPAEKSKKVAVVGGGPAGMEAAWVAAQRGHKVILYEEKDKLGGQLLAASQAPYKGEIADLISSLSRRMNKSGVTVKLGLEATAELIEGEEPEAVVIATGAVPIVPEDISGAKGRNVLSALDIFADIKEVGQRVVVIGGGLVGCEIAELLSQKGKKVTILEMLDEIGTDLGQTNKRAMLYYLQKAGVDMVVKTKVQEITDKGVKAIQDNTMQFYEADTVVIAVGFTPDNDLIRRLSGKIPALFPIGDCVESRKIIDAISDGARVGREI